MARSIVLMPDDRCVLAGSVGYQSALVGVMPNASYDPSFGTQGVVDVQVGSSSTSIYSAIRQPWDKVLITGGYSDGSIVGMFLGRYHADGTPDAGFGTNGFATHVPGTVGGDGRAIGIQSDGRIVVAGNTGGLGSADVFVVRYNNDLATNVSPSAPASDALTVSPAPAAEALTVHRPAAARGSAEISILTARGERLVQRSSSAAQDQLSVHELPPGVYFLRYATSGATWTTRFAVAR
jgi:uncharacterized delta-60 repeat protein